MRAVRLHEFGGPEVLRLEELARPAPGAGEVLVRLRAAALNHLDVWVRLGSLPVKLPLVPGSEGAGVVEAAGAGVRGWEPGARVAVGPWIYSGGAGGERPNLSLATLGVARDGCYAEYVAVPAGVLLPIAAELGFEEAASLPLAFTTAYHMLFTRARLEAGEDVLVIGASGGVGVAAVQLAHGAGARVIAVTRDPAKGERLRELGADEVVSPEGDFGGEVRRLTGGRGADLVVEQVGRTTWAGSAASVRRGGRIVTCGATSGAEATVNLQDLYRREIALLGSYAGTPEEMRRVFKLAEEGRLRPVIDRVHPLEEAGAAHARMEQSAHLGKILLRP